MSRIRKLLGCREVLAGRALAAVGCEGTAGTSAVTSNPTQLNLQCKQPIFIPGQLLQTFGGWK